MTPAVPRALLWLNLLLLALYPVAWTAPLMRAGLLPLFGLQEISILSGIAALWQGQERALALLVAVFALAAPMAKTAALAAIQLGRVPARFIPGVELLSKLAMADVFLIAVYVTLAKGLAVGRVETAWGLWLFTACVLGQLMLGAATAARIRTASRS